MTRHHRRLAPPSWLHLPGRSARLRLTLLYGALFLASGAVLLTITYLLSQQAIDSGTAPVRLPTSSPVPVPAAPTDGTLSSQARAALAAAKAAGRQLGEQRAADLHHLLISSGIALAVVAVLALLLGWYVAGRVLRPVRTITATARRISASNLHERLALGGTDEFKALGNTLDELFDRLEAAFESQRHFVANASHELRTPLAAERTLLQLALDDPDTTAETWRSTSQRVIASNRKQESLVDALLTLASSDSGIKERQRIDLSVICNRVLNNRADDIEDAHLRLETTIRAAPFDGDPRLIERLLNNLVDNAIKYNSSNGHIRLSTTAAEGRAVLNVTNTGPVIPVADVERLFQPFQRLDPRRTHHREGHGLGLSIVRAIAVAHGAQMNANAEPEGGLAVTVSFSGATTLPVLPTGYVTANSD